MKKLQLSHMHQSLGAKMIDFSNFYMPLQYEGITIEHQTVREKVGVFDVSHMGEFLISGSSALELIQKVTANDASKLHLGQAQYSYIPNDRGGIVDDLIVYRLKKEQYMMVVNASNIQKDWDWIISQNTMKADIRNISDQYSLLSVQGPKAIKSLQLLTSVNLKDIPFYSFKVADFAEVPYVIISATGYTGSGGVEIYCKNEEVEQIWKAILSSGSQYGIKPIGLAARDSLRLEMGYCLYGNDIDDTTSPIEANLGWVTKFTKNFINSKSIKEQYDKGVSRKMVGFEIESRGIPRNGYKIFNKDEKVIGKVTSGIMSPSLKKGIGLGYVHSDFTKIGNNIFIGIRDKKIAAKVVKTPFYKP